VSLDPRTGHGGPESVGSPTPREPRADPPPGSPPLRLGGRDLVVGVTGSLGLIGTALVRQMAASGVCLRGLDFRADPGSPEYGDILDEKAVARSAEGCSGIVHLAGVSRVLTGERDPGDCLHTNRQGTANVVNAALAMNPRPWVVFASSREVYGQAADLPVGENAPYSPVNVYGRSKVLAEQEVLSARTAGLRAVTLRFSNVYGSVVDYPDRVVPCFARAAARDGVLSVEGPHHTFDFTHVEDVARGILAVVVRLESEDHLPTAVHLVSGRGTTLGELADLAIAAAEGRGRRVDAPSRAYDVARFVGDPSLASIALGWRAAIGIEKGVRALVREFRHASV
jgi:nucleoside-diphosphate-sugar epimerase